jgi:asparagine synthase (glutamine-hydrolysing)
VKVALSADGGDELFNGYSHYGVLLGRSRALARWPLAARRAAAGALGAIGASRLAAAAMRLPAGTRARHALRRNVAERLARLGGVLPQLDRTTFYDLAMSVWMPWEIEEILGGYRGRAPARSPAGDFADHMARCDIGHWLPDDILVKVDRTTMAHGLEGREPMLDHRVIEFALRLPLAMRRGALGPKHLLRKILYRYVPRELVERPKQGFAVPLARWLRGDLAPLLDEYLAPGRIRAGGLLDPDVVGRTLANFREGGPDNDRLDTQKIWHLLAFEMWRERWLVKGIEKSPGVEDARAVHY